VASIERDGRPGNGGEAEQEGYSRLLIENSDEETSRKPYYVISLQQLFLPPGLDRKLGVLLLVLPLQARELHRRFGTVNSFVDVSV
jgi:hypothetical protein